MSNQNSELRNPTLWFGVAFVLGIALGAWGLIKEDCQGGPGCWIGSGFLEISGGALILLGFLGWLFTGGRGK